MKRTIFRLLFLSIIIITSCAKEEVEPTIIHSADGKYTIEFKANNANSSTSNMTIAWNYPPIELAYNRGNTALIYDGAGVITGSDAYQAFDIELLSGETLKLHWDVGIQNATDCTGLSHSIIVNGTVADSKTDECGVLSYELKQ